MIIGFILLVAVCIPGLWKLNVTVEMDDYFLKDDPVLSAGREFNSVFSGGEFVGVLFESSDVFSPDSLELIHIIGQRLIDKVPDTTDLLSIAVLDGTLTGGNRLDFDGDELLTDQAGIEAFRESVSLSPLLGGSLVSSGGNEAWIIVNLEYDAAGGDEITIGEYAWEALEGLELGEDRITLSGMPVVAYRKYVELMEDLIRVIVIAGVVATLLSLIILRSFKGVLGTLGVLTGSVVTVLGAQGWMGATLDSGFLGVPILLTMGISIGYTVHVHRYYRIAIAGGAAPLDATATALSRTVRPIFFTAVTTIASLLSFLFVAIRPIRWVGYTSAISVLLAFLLSVMFFPAIMSFGNPQKVRKENVGFGCPEKLFRWIARLAVQRRVPVILIFVIATGLSAWGLSRLRVDFDAVEMMGTRLPHMQDQLHVGESEIAVGEFMNLMITLPEGYFLDPEGIRRISELETRLTGIDGVRRVSSITSVLGEVNSLMHRRNPDYAGLPENDVSLGALIRFLKSVLPDQQGAWVDEGGMNARLLVETSDFSSRRIEALIDKVLNEISDIFPQGVKVTVSGSTYQMAMMNQYITRGLVRSVGTALGVISIIMILVFGSLRWGIVAMIPNVFPVLIAGSILGFAGIPLEFVTMTVAPIILGLAVDDTIHFMGGLRDGLGAGRPFLQVLEENLLSIGTAISQTTFILCSAFIIFAFSRVNSIRNMGIIAAAGMLSAYLADLLLVPVLTGMLGGQVGKIRTGEKNTEDDSGEAPRID